jgi:hypothetical protein
MLVIRNRRYRMITDRAAVAAGIVLLLTLTLGSPERPVAALDPPEAASTTLTTKADSGAGMPALLVDLGLLLFLPR